MLDFIYQDLHANLGAKLHSSLLTTPSTLVTVCLSTSIVYFFMVFFMQFSRRPFVGQSSTFDLVLMLVLANAVQNAMVVGDNSLIGGIAAALTLFAWDGLLGLARRTFPRSRKILGGERIKIMEDGKPLDERLARERLDRDDLSSILAKNGLKSFDQICDAYVEIDGSVTLIPHPDSDMVRNSQVRHRSKHH